MCGFIIKYCEILWNTYMKFHFPCQLFLSCHSWFTQSHIELCAQIYLGMRDTSPCVTATAVPAIERFLCLHMYTVTRQDSVFYWIPRQRMACLNRSEGGCEGSDVGRQCTLVPHKLPKTTVLVMHCANDVLCKSEVCHLSTHILVWSHTKLQGACMLAICSTSCSWCHKTGCRINEMLPPSVGDPACSTWPVMARAVYAYILV